MGFRNGFDKASLLHSDTASETKVPGSYICVIEAVYVVFPVTNPGREKEALKPWALPGAELSGSGVNAMIVATRRRSVSAHAPRSYV